MSANLPSWFKQKLPTGESLALHELLSTGKTHTVCAEARCPNICDCSSRNEFTFMILGDTCTRYCRFCAVKKNNGGRLGLDLHEPSRISAAVGSLGQKFVVITSVCRDDLSDSGARVFADTIRAIHRVNRQIKVEALIPDFKASASSLGLVIDSGPCVIAHNIETVKRLYGCLRPQASYEVSLGVLEDSKKMDAALLTKSSLMLGLGETEPEVIRTLEELRQCKCDILTLGQYLSPGNGYYPVHEFINPEQFTRYEMTAYALGFKAVISGPTVRSSYKAQELYRLARDFVS